MNKAKKKSRAQNIACLPQQLPKSWWSQWHDYVTFKGPVKLRALGWVKSVMANLHNLKVEFVADKAIKFTTQKCNLVIDECHYLELKKVIKVAVRKKSSEVCNKRLRISKSVVCHFKPKAFHLTRDSGNVCIVPYDSLKDICEYISRHCWDGTPVESDRVLLQNLSAIFSNLDNHTTKKYIEGVRKDNDFILTKLSKYVLKSSDLKMNNEPMIFILKDLFKQRVNAIELNYYANKIALSL